MSDHAREEHTQLPAERGEARLPVEDELCAAAMDGVSVVEHQGKHELRFDMKRLREGFRRAFARTSGSCLICGVERAFVVMANGVGICEPCRCRALAAPAAPPETTPHTTEAIARRIAERLFNVGRDHPHAQRLVLTIDRPEPRNLGGWAFEPAVREIERGLQDFQPAAPAAGEAQPQRSLRDTGPNGENVVTSLILANLRDEDIDRFHAAKIGYSGSTGKGSIHGYEPYGPYIATYLCELPSILKALRWEHVALEMPHTPGGSAIAHRRLAAGEAQPDWKRAALLKLRTWDAIQDRAHAGESAASLADDFGVPEAWIQHVLAPENTVAAGEAQPDKLKKNGITIYQCPMCGIWYSTREEAVECHQLPAAPGRRAPAQEPTT